MIGVIRCLKIDELGTCLHDGKWGGDVIVNEKGNLSCRNELNIYAGLRWEGERKQTIGVEAQVPILLLLAGLQLPDDASVESMWMGRMTYRMRAVHSVP